MKKKFGLSELKAFLRTK